MHPLLLMSAFLAAPVWQKTYLVETQKSRNMVENQPSSAGVASHQLVETHNSSPDLASELDSAVPEDEDLASELEGVASELEEIVAGDYMEEPPAEAGDPVDWKAVKKDLVKLMTDSKDFWPGAGEYLKQYLSIQRFPPLTI